MSMIGQSRSLGILFCMPKIKEPMVKRSTFSFFHWNRKSEIGDPVIISSLSILNLPHPTLLRILLVGIQILLCYLKSFLRLLVEN